MTRYGQVIELKPEYREEYIRYHADVWPGVLATIADCQIRNYSIFLHDDVLYAYFEYHGTDFEADMKKMGECPETQKWWALMEPMQQPLPTVQPGGWWTAMQEVFHFDGPPVKGS